MAYRPHTLVTFGGIMQEAVAGDEIWQCGIRGVDPAGDPILESNLQTLADNVWNGNGGSGGGLSALFARADGVIPNTVQLKWVKAANIKADGTYSAEPAVHQGTVTGPASAAKAPSFCTVAISFGTGLTLGRGIRGRIYPPNFAASINVGAVVASSYVSGLVTWGGDLLTVLHNALSSDPFIPSVVSKTGELHAITEVRVGNIYDTQRRRKNATPETYTSASWSP